MFAALTLALPPQFPLTIESIMRGPALIGNPPRGLRWSPDGSRLRFSWAKADGTQNPRFGDFVVNKDGSGLAEFKGEWPSVPANPARGHTRGTQTVYESSGDLYLRDETTKAVKRLTETTGFESNARLISNDAVGFTLDGDLYRLKISDGTKTQLTTRAAGAPPSSGEPKPVPIVTPEGYRAGALAITPNGKFGIIDFSQTITAGRRADVPSYVTRSGYPEMLPTYSRVGSPQPSSRISIVDLSNGGAMEMGANRPGRVTRLQWSPTGRYAIAWAQATDYKDDWILGFDEETGKVSTLWTEHCDAWVGGPLRGTLGWLPDGSGFYFGSEKSGYSSLYFMPSGGGEAKLLVGGSYEVHDVRLDSDRKRFTFVSSEDSPFRRQLGSIELDGKNKRKLAELSADEGMTYAIAPNGTDVAVVRSKPNRPPELFVADKQVTTSPTEEWLAGPWIEPEVVMVPSTDGVKVPSRLYKSKKWRKGGPAVIFVHGAGYLQNVYDGWSHYFREYMFHHLLMEQGYLVLDMDYRASAGYGRDWRTAIYRYMGGKDLDDNLAGATYLIEKQGAGKDRLGIYGGSYGGFITLMAMFTKPDVFTAGAALRPVADWASYHHGYTAPILNTPKDDPEAYKRSSPINFVEGFKGALLICHGMVDVNVAFQDSIRVAQKLIELGKTNWEIAPYPVEDHAFTQPSSWTDEYRRIFELFERTIGSKRGRR